ncbi:TIGR01458 family HAD-type hydrolase [Pseudomonas indica]|uniref:Haloacid dehalogenase-like hydrolase domain-containing protein 2 n=1 Tax=Pseudomonas indica TaxID=137658 RepID=A0A1G8Z7I6_9PSED|nr:TIGR01458 family HAD-type hydrolase [Pseudomonas indica]MBU3055310.1 TIGR01458 family HAD-type hydrolase [Pseudomonas indica]PAU51258.1 hydrolase [Pseudomonas indica]SDK10998.1 HAD-superfamily subfamily IIA hydrolase, TIGR01458 [Pseudomonas indica]
MPKAILLDISGVLYEDARPLPGAVEAVRQLRDKGYPLRLVTNTSRLTAAEIHRQLSGMGFGLSPGQIFSAPQAARRYLAAHGLRPYCLIHPNLEEEFADLLDLPQPNAVLVGDAESRFDYAHLERAFHLLIEGAPLIAMGDNRYFHSRGALRLDAGPFVRALEYAADTQALVLGKPSADFFNGALHTLGVAPQDALMIGDDVEGDVLGAQKAGLQACLVRTGKYREGDEARAPGAGLAADLADAVRRYC